MFRFHELIWGPGFGGPAAGPGRLPQNAMGGLASAFRIVVTLAHRGSQRHLLERALRRIWQARWESLPAGHGILVRAAYHVRVGMGDIWEFGGAIPLGVGRNPVEVRMWAQQSETRGNGTCVQREGPAVMSQPRPGTTLRHRYFWLS